MTRLATESVALWLNEEFVVKSGGGVATSVVPPVRVVVVGDGISAVRYEIPGRPKVTDVKALVAFCIADARSVTTAGRDKDVLVPAPKTSPAGVFSAGLRATRGGNVVNSLGRTSCAVGKVAIVVVCAGAWTSRLPACLIP